MTVIKLLTNKYMHIKEKSIYLYRLCVYLSWLWSNILLGRLGTCFNTCPLITILLRDLRPICEERVILILSIVYNGEMTKAKAKTFE